MMLHDIFESHNPVLQEATRIGREYQHLEDLLITDGSQGGIDAVTELKSIAQQPGTMNMKWDGGAAVFWGRDEQGNFVFAPNNQWSKGQKLDRESLATEIQGTGRPRQGQTPEEFAAIRQGMAANYMRLWDLFEKATPKDFKGYLNGDLMFTERQTPGADGYYEFTPNKVTYRVSPHGLYGKMKTAEAFVAVHGKIEEFGAEATGNLEPVPDAEIQRFNKTRKLIVLPTQHPTVQLKPVDQEVATTLGLIKNNATAIDTIANYTADRFTGFKKILYDYAVKRAKSDGILTFEAWLKDCKLSPKQKTTTQEVITAHAREWKVFWTAFDAILKLKHDVLDDLHDVHSKHMDDKLGITAITAGSPGGEGYVKAMSSGGMAKLVNPKFRSAPDNPRFTPHLNESVPGAASKRNPIDWIKNLDGVLNVGTDDSIFFALGSIGKKIDYLPRKFPSITRRLNKSKDKIIKTILVHLKDGNEDQYLTDALRALKMFDISWSELEIIKKSFDHDQANKNNIDTDIDEAWDYGDYLNSHHLVRSKILQGLNSVDRSIYGPLAERLEFPYKAQNSIIFAIRYIYGYRNSITGTIADRLEPYKEEILKELLSDIAESGIDSATNKLLIGLRVAGVTWPELATIQKSVDYELTKPTELDEGYRDIIWSKRHR